jgi:hypothetical protein
MKRYILLGWLLSINAYGQDLHTLSTTAFHRESINQRSLVINKVPLLLTDANIEGGISINGSDFQDSIYQTQDWYSAYLYNLTLEDTVEVIFRIRPEQPDWDKEADIFVMVGYATLDKLMIAHDTGELSVKEDVSYFSLDQSNTIRPLSKDWTGRDLVPFQRLKLKPTQDITIYRGKMPRGVLGIVVGYQTQHSDIIVLNQDLILAAIFHTYESPITEFPSYRDYIE